MTDDLLHYYNSELAFLRHMGAEFASNHHKIAGRLRLGENAVEDPHVARLIESAAFLNARIRCKLEDDFPELTDALFEVLYPHYLAPIPSMAIASLELARDVEDVHEIAAGAFVETDREHGEPCRFRTCYDVTLLPIEVAEARLEAAPFTSPTTLRSTSAQGVLRLTIRTLSESASIKGLGIDRIRLFLGGQLPVALSSYELLLNDVLEVAVATSERDRRPQLLGPEIIRPVGFADDEGVLPCPGRSNPAYRLLTEYFAFPAKFLFVDLCDLAGPALQRADREFTLYFFLRRCPAELQQSLTAASFVLGATPIVNLFPRRAEPVRLDGREPEILVVPNARRPHAIEVHSIDAVSAVAPDGSRCDYRPFFGLDHGRDEGDTPGRYYHVVRRDVGSSSAKSARGTEVALRLVDESMRPRSDDASVVTVETTCLNRDLPARLPFGVNEPRMALVDGSVPVARVRCLTAPTRTVRPRRGEGAQWRLISHLSLNHLSIVGGKDAATALREVLRLYDYVGDAATAAVIDSVLSVDARPVAMRIATGGRSGFARGTEIRLELDGKRFSDRGLFLFASVLEVFFGIYCSVNSFVRLSVDTGAREGGLRRWPARSGTRQIV